MRLKQRNRNVDLPQPEGTDEGGDALFWICMLTSNSACSSP
jgi:hypothetical protein